jgi:hypothetical protein
MCICIVTQYNSSKFYVFMYNKVPFSAVFCASEEKTRFITRLCFTKQLFLAVLLFVGPQVFYCFF